MKHKISTVMFSAGWLESQFENMVANTAPKQDEDPSAHLVAEAINEQWAIISAALDDLIKENNELKRKLSVVESAFL